MRDPVSPAAKPSIDIWLPLALLAIVAPTLLAANDPPSVTFYNQTLAVFGWGLWMAALAAYPASRQGHGLPRQAVLALGAALLINATMAMLSPALNGLPLGLAMMGAGQSLAALLVVAVGWRIGLDEDADRHFDTFCQALAWAGVLGLLLAGIQVFHPAWADGNWIAGTTMPGRAVGNLRQPNHFSSLLVWSVCATAWLAARGRWPLWLAMGAMVLMIGGVVLTASRTGMVGMLLLAIWGWRDRDLPRPLRVLLMGAPVVYGACWGGMWLWSHADSQVAFAAEARLHDKSDISSSRFKIWANVFSLIAQQPWFGVGYGEFNLAWTLTPFPDRPVAFFDHTHDIILQWAVEFGLPLTLLLTGLCCLALWVLVRPRRAPAEAGTIAGSFQGSPAGAAAVMVAIIGFHSLLEYPLWYSYFLLPTAFAWAMGLAARARQQGLSLPAESSSPSRMGQRLTVAALTVSLCAVWCTWDYLAAANIYAPREGAGPLANRISYGQRMPWFGYQADYADVTTRDEDESAPSPQAFRRTVHNLLDARLMMAYARSLAEHGEVDKARYVVDRLREFRSATAQEFFDACNDPLDEGEAAPFQCAPAQGQYTWRDLRPH